MVQRCIKILNSIQFLNYLKTNKFLNKMKILVRGWYKIPHSYGIVNCFQLIHLQKNVKDIEIYIEEMPYYMKNWNNNKKLVYNEEYNNIINEFKNWSGEKVDIVYSITYEYDITKVIVNGENIPKCVFYTSEFGKLDRQYFIVYENNNKCNFRSEEDLKRYMEINKEIYFTSPSKWSSKGLLEYDINRDRNRTITHGVDTSIFKLNGIEQRNETRERYKINKEDVLMINIGAMTQNKGILQIIETMNELVNKKGKKKFKLMLKGTGDLYESKKFIELYFEKLKIEGKITQSEEENLLRNNIIFIDKTLSYERINDLFNAADIYFSPYIAEGFNLTVLEALATGMQVIVPETGSTEDYINKIGMENGDYIHKVRSQVVELEDGKKQNHIKVSDIVKTIIEEEYNIEKMKMDRTREYKKLVEYIEENYSWKRVSEMLYEYLEYIIEKSNKKFI